MSNIGIPGKFIFRVDKYINELTKPKNIRENKQLKKYIWLTSRYSAHCELK
jgi:hypothetical protein